MPKIDEHAMNGFCWVELATTDQNGAKEFYSSLFGWSPVDSPMGANGYYTRFKQNGGDAAAAFTMNAQEQSMIPPHWSLYISVENADDTAKRAAEGGATVIEPPFDVMTIGRMAVIQDPTGAIFNIWQRKDHSGITVAGENGTFCWADLSTPDPGRAKQFYEGLFGWKIGPSEPYPPEYLVVQNAGKPIAGIPPAAHRNPAVPPHWMLFFQVSDVDGLAAKAKQLGGKEHMAPMSVGGARLSVLADPQGAAFSILHVR